MRHLIRRFAQALGSAERAAIRFAQALGSAERAAIRFAQALGSAERAAIRFTLLACLAALALGAAACGDEEPGVDEPAREGLALPLEGVDYNVFITRQLNPAIPPDDTYVEGPEPAPDETLYGVFVQVCNVSDEARGTVENFKVVDSQGNEFEPEELPEDNAFAYHARELDPKECIPEAGSVAQLGPSAGSMLLFKLPLQVTENRPLELEIEGEGDEHLTFELDI